MHIVLACATQRGVSFFKRLRTLLPEAQLTVVSFPEEPWEPEYVSDLRLATDSSQTRLIITRRVDGPVMADFWADASVDLMLCVGWRYVIPSDIFQRPRLGTFIFHDSLLPKYRGFAPTVWAMIHGCHQTGVTLLAMDEKIDEGDIVAQNQVGIAEEDTIDLVLTKVTAAYLDLLEANLDALVDGTAKLIPQDHSKATYACKWVPEDGYIDWSNDSESIYNLIRALTKPYPGAFTTLQGNRLSIWKAKRLKFYKKFVGSMPGRVIEVIPGRGSVVLTGDGAILLTEVQIQSGQPICAAELLNQPSQTLGR